MGLSVIVIRGAGDLASGVAMRLFHAGMRVAMTEIAAPMAVRRSVCFSEAIYEKAMQVEDLTGRLSASPRDAAACIAAGEIPVLLDPELNIVQSAPDVLNPAVIVDARLLKRFVPKVPAGMVIGLGPGFEPGMNCDAAVETMRGHLLGRVYWTQAPLANTGLPDGNPDRVLRAHVDGRILPIAAIAERVVPGEKIAEIENEEGRHPVIAVVGGVLRGMLRTGTRVQAGVKIGDIDERADPDYCRFVSDKALAIGGGVLEAVLAFRSRLPDLYR